MKTDPQKQYDSPRIRVLEIKFEGIICESEIGITSGSGSGYGEDNDIDD